MSEVDALHAGFAVEVAEELARTDARVTEPGVLGDAIRRVSERRRVAGRPVPLVRRWADLGSKPWREWTADAECVAEFQCVLGAVPGRAARMRGLERELSRAASVEAFGVAWDAMRALNSEVLAEVNEARRAEQRLILQDKPE